MANRPVYMPTPDKKPFVKEEGVEFVWSPGMAVIQKQKSIRSLHKSAKEAFGFKHVLEISSKSEKDYGRSLSAFNLKFQIDDTEMTVESAFQGSKVFDDSGPFYEFYTMTGREIKKDGRLAESGKLVKFSLLGDEWDLEPKTAFYDWLYLNALIQNPALSAKLKNHQGFTDIEFNPKKSLNCQARSAALYVALDGKIDIKLLLQDKQKFIETIYTKTSKAEQNKLF
jgi:hypothetical protein